MIVKHTTRVPIMQYQDGGDEREERMQQLRAEAESADEQIESIKVTRHLCDFDCRESEREQGIKICVGGYVTHDVVMITSREIES